MQVSMPQRPALASPRTAMVAVVLLLVASLGVALAGPERAGASVGSLSGPVGGGFWRSFLPKVGANGQVVAYATALRNFDATAPVDPLRIGVYLRDRNTSAAVKNVNVVRPVGGGLPNGDSYPLGVSPDAATRYVLYSSAASNIVAGDTNGKQDVFLFDRVAGTTERVSVGGGGTQGDGDVFRAAISGNTAGDGLAPRYVAFVSAASNVVAGDVNGKADVFLRDRVTGTTTLVSRASGVSGAAANSDSFDVSVSDNGRYVAFSSGASNLVAGDTNNAPDVFVRDTVANTTERVSVGFIGEGSGGSSTPQISADGRFVAFDSDADDLVPNDDNLSYDVFVRDRLSGSTERVSVGPNGEQGEDDSTDPSMSRDGRYIAFESDAEEFSVNDGNISADAYVRDRLAHNTVRASEKSNNLDAFADAEDAAISPEGQFVAFDIDSSDYNDTTDTNDDYDVYIKDLSTFYNSAVVGSRFQTVTPKRLLDTGSSGTPLVAGTTRDLLVSGATTGVPANAQAVMLNITASGETSAGADLAVYPTGQSKPKTTTLWPQVGRTVSNEVAVKVGANGKVTLATAKGSTDVSVDVVGYFAPDDGNAYAPAPSGALVNTAGVAVPAGWPARQPLSAGGSFAKIDVPVAGVADVPANAAAVAAFVSVSSPSVTGSKVSVFPSGTPDPGLGTLYPQSGSVVTNLVVVPVGSERQDLTGSRQRHGQRLGRTGRLLRADRF